MNLKILRAALGLSISEMAEALGLDGAGAADRVRELERGTRPVTGPLNRLLDYLNQAADVEADPREHDLALHVLPRFLDCADLADESAAEIVLHTRYPRFYAVMVSSETPLDDETRAALDAGELTLLDMPAEQGLDPFVILWIDRPVKTPTAALEALRRLKIEQAKRDLE